MRNRAGNLQNAVGSFDLEAELLEIEKQSRSRSGHYSKLLKSEDIKKRPSSRSVLSYTTDYGCSIHPNGQTREDIDWANAEKAGLFCDQCVADLEKRIAQAEAASKRLEERRDKRPLDLTGPKHTVQNAPRWMVINALHKSK